MAGTQTPAVSKDELEKAVNALEVVCSQQLAVSARQKMLDANLKAFDIQHAYHQVRAPIAGRLGQFKVALDENLTAGKLITEVTNLDNIHVLCAVGPHVVSRLAAGMPARLALPHKEHAKEVFATGKVEFIDTLAQPETGTFDVKIRFPNKDHMLRLNATTRVEVLVEPEKARQVIPEAALMEDLKEPVVVVAEEGEIQKGGKIEKGLKARRLRARLGVRDRKQGLVEILGLETLDEDKEKKPVEITKELLFIVKDGHGLKDGDEVKIDEEGH